MCGCEKAKHLFTHIISHPNSCWEEQSNLTGRPLLVSLTLTLRFKHPRLDLWLHHGLRLGLITQHVPPLLRVTHMFPSTSLSRPICGLLLFILLSGGSWNHGSCVASQGLSCTGKIFSAALWLHSSLWPLFLKPFLGDSLFLVTRPSTSMGLCPLVFTCINEELFSTCFVLSLSRAPDHRPQPHEAHLSTTPVGPRELLYITRAVLFLCLVSSDHACLYACHILGNQKKINCILRYLWVSASSRTITGVGDTVITNTDFFSHQSTQSSSHRKIHASKKRLYWKTSIYD